MRKGLHGRVSFSAWTNPARELWPRGPSQSRDSGPSYGCIHAVVLRTAKGGDEILNPLAIGVTVGGLLLDAIAPRPKPRVGFAYEPLLSTLPVRGHRGGERPAGSKTIAGRERFTT
jgi:hypothetical protein